MYTDYYWVTNVKECVTNNALPPQLFKEQDIAQTQPYYSIIFSCKGFNIRQQIYIGTTSIGDKRTSIRRSYYWNVLYLQPISPKCKNYTYKCCVYIPPSENFLVQQIILYVNRQCHTVHKKILRFNLSTPYHQVDYLICFLHPDWRTYKTTKRIESVVITPLCSRYLA